MNQRLSANLNKWLATFRISWSQQMAYKLNFFLLILGPVFVFFFIRYNLWSSIYHLQKLDSLQGYTLDKMIAYQVWVLIVALLALSYTGMNIAMEIRLGRISSYLIYPFGFWSFHTASFLSFQTLQIFITAFTLACILLKGWISLPEPWLFFNGITLSL